MLTETRPELRHEVRRNTAMGAVLTFRSGDDSSSVLLHPDDDDTITTPDGSDIVIHIDEHIHHRAKCVGLGAHPTGLRVVDDPARTHLVRR